MYLQLNDVELSFFGYAVDVVAVGVMVEDVADDGVRNTFRGTETHPLFSPSLERANSRINFPSIKTKKMLQ